MADPFSTAAAAISLIDIAIKAAREVGSLVSTMHNAPDEILRINGQVALFESLMRQIQNLQLTYSHSTLREQNQNAFRLKCSALQQSAKDLQDLRKRLGALIHKSDPSATRILEKNQVHVQGRGYQKIGGQVGYPYRAVQHRFDTHRTVYCIHFSYLGDRLD